jgi:hypothetical protein
MGLRMRKSFKVAPGVQMTVSKSGIGYSVGGKGVRVTKRADGRVQTTVGLPGSGISYTSVRKRSTSRSARGSATARGRSGAQPRQAALRVATQIARQQVPMTLRIKRERLLGFIGIGATVVGFALPPLLLVAIPCLLVGLVMILTNFKDEQRWSREYHSARTQALTSLLNSGPER